MTQRSLVSAAATVLAAMTLVGTGCRTGKCMDCGPGRMRPPNPWECSSVTPMLTCAGGRDGCEAGWTEDHACVPDGAVRGAGCGGGEQLTCPGEQVDACRYFLGITHVCVEVPPWLDPATGKVRDDAFSPAPAATPAEAPLLADSAVDYLLDIDQAREPVPGGSWTEQRYVGPKQYDRLFVEITHHAPASLEAEPRGPLADIDRVELFVGEDRLPAGTVLRSDTAALRYHAETAAGFEYDGRGGYLETEEQLRIYLGPAVAAHVAAAHPFQVTLRARTAAGALVLERTFAGDEAGAYPTIQPPRPY